jgi:16S rRNA C967 or C1407 C5-methylase (RsmB/RsmF family)/NOL1/NOP2/fmu family ribosome biogenesis protein
MFPEAFKYRLAGQKYLDADALLKALDEPSPVSIRKNNSKWDKRPLNAENVPWCSNGFYLDSRPSYTLDPLFHSGCYYPQEASGMFLEEAVRQTFSTLANLRVLDLCGSPGGKSTILSDIIGPHSMLVSNEVIRSRAVVLAETVTKWGLGNTLVTQSDPSAFGRLSGYFDLVLVDAPCSGEGMFRTGIAVDEWSVENAAHCSVRQKRILMDIWPALKENGILIYSTCTFNPAENEENVKWLSEKHMAETVRLNIQDFKGITEIEFNGIFGYGFYPGNIRGEGFFISVLRKLGKQDNFHLRKHQLSDFILSKRDFEIADKWTHFDKGSLIKWGEEVISVPCGMDEYLYLFQNIKVVKAGTKIFAVKKNDYLPSYESALCRQLKKDAFPKEDLDYDGAISYLRRDNFKLYDSIKGWSIVTYKDINLGYVKNIGKRLNNYFPVELRIRMDLPDKGTTNILKWLNDENGIT